MTIHIYVVDAFTDEPFKGNPAAVCITDEPQDEAWMHLVAAEMNLSETAFLHPVEDGYSLRWFTPTTEVDLCGHATLASAHILWELGYLAEQATARFHTRSGLLTASRNGAWIQMKLPADEPAPVDDYPELLLEALQVTPLYVGKGLGDYLIEIESEEQLRSLTPNLSLLEQVPARGVLVTARSKSYDFVSRCFFPAVGIPEDPVTGSAHCTLGAYWSAKLSKQRLEAYQASSRGGVVKIEIQPSAVMLEGQVVTVLKCQMSDR